MCQHLKMYNNDVICNLNGNCSDYVGISQLHNNINTD